MYSNLVTKHQNKKSTALERPIHAVKAHVHRHICRTITWSIFDTHKKQRSQQSHNVEYIKNLTVKYLETKDATMLRALSTALQIRC